LVNWGTYDLINQDFDDSVGGSSEEIPFVDKSLTTAFWKMFVNELQGQPGGAASSGNHGPLPAVLSDEKPPAPKKPLMVLQLHYETDLTKVMKGWPNKDCPRFTKGIGENAADWLLTMGVSLSLLCDNRTQEMRGTIVDSKKDKERITIVGKKWRKRKKRNRVMTLMMMIPSLLWAILLLSLKEDGLRAAKLNPSSLDKQRRFSLRLP
jgi:hypothetical protein